MADTLAGESLALEDLLNNPAATIVARLAQSPISIESETVALADIVEATFPGYAAVEIEDWEVFPGQQSDTGEALSPTLEFTSDGIVTPQTITAMYITVQIGTGALTILDACPFDPPIVIDQDGITIARNYRLFSYDPTDV